MYLLLFYLSLALMVSFLCSILEAVILSVSTSFIQIKESEGKRSAKQLKKLKNKIDRPLSAILCINTVAHTIGAAGVGAQAVAVFGEIYFGIISAVLTIAILIFSEIIPKTIGAIFWRELALPSTKLIIVMIYLSYPLVILSDFITSIFSKHKKSQIVTREEVSALASIGTKEGILNENESKIINNILQLRTVKLQSILTPRTVVVAAPEEMPLTDYIKEKNFLQHSRVPVYSENKDNITGYVLNSDILEALADRIPDKKLTDIKRTIITFYENSTIPKLFEEFLDKKEHIALIVNEYGEMQGLVTMEDIFETMLGLEIIDEKDSEINMQQLARKKWEIRKEGLDIEKPDEE